MFALYLSLVYTTLSPSWFGTNPISHLHQQQIDALVRHPNIVEQVCH